MYAILVAATPRTQDFGEIYKAYHRRVFSLCRYLLNSKDAAEDAAHEVFLRAQWKFSTYDDRMPLSSWLLGIASNYCIDLLRRRGVEMRVFETAAAELPERSSRGPGPLTQLLATEQGDRILDALSELPDRFRIVLVLAYYNELRYDEIARMLGLKRSHVATLIFRAKQQLREKLQEKYL